MLSKAGLPHKFWGEAVCTATYFNFLPTKPNKKTPYELWTNRKPDLSHIRILGCKAYAYVRKQKRGKLDDKAVEGVYLGYDNRSKGYRIYLGVNNTMISRTLKFEENYLPYDEKELKNQEENTKQLVKLDLGHEENQKMEEEYNERIKVNPCEDEEKVIHRKIINPEDQKEKQK
ncbi:Copia protein [Araneus ventricosus]|uniref:Copia protein n=1 Tax=Araneus ventricosus TaxID=182803 RepID=A0A4Y2KGA3_ARAVE|nr:Copia protein [Araneus ventricosus]